MASRPRQSDHAPHPAIGLPGADVAAILAGIGWVWAAAVIAGRDHHIFFYSVTASPPGWGFLTARPGVLVLALLCGIALAAACRRGGAAARTGTTAARWLLASLLIPALDLARLAGLQVPLTFLEPLYLAFVTGSALRHTVGIPLDSQAGPLARKVPWTLVVWLLAAAACAWWFGQASRAYGDYLLGYQDFGHFARRVINTWEGRGLLRTSPDLPIFWDHFNPALALLAPLWGLWADARLFLLIQAVCLAAPAPLVYGIARRWGATPAAAAAWAGAYLVFPAVGQLNLNYSYGWRSDGLALPFVFGALWAMSRSWRALAAASAAVACCCAENVFVLLACIAVVTALRAWLGGRHRRRPGSTAADDPIASRLPAWGWLAVAAVLAAGFFTVSQFTPISKFQATRFGHLGESAGQVVLSPILRPRAFWGAIFQRRSAWFVLALAVPIGLRSLGRGWTVLLALALPLGVLLAWNNPPATSIAFQYTITLIPVLFLAAMAGAAAPSRTRRDVPRSAALLAAGWAALAGGAAASLALGALPWSSPTLGLVRGATYGEAADDRAAGSPGGAVLAEIVARARREDPAVLASGRVAAHLLNLSVIEPVRSVVCVPGAHAGQEAYLANIEQFAWVILDTRERFQQSYEEMANLARRADEAGFVLARSFDGILLYVRPGRGGAAGASPTRPAR